MCVGEKDPRISLLWQQPTAHAGSTCVCMDLFFTCETGIPKPQSTQPALKQARDNLILGREKLKQ